MNGLLGDKKTQDAPDPPFNQVQEVRIYLTTEKITLRGQKYKTKSIKLSHAPSQAP
jgi:hypothetical protein